MAVGDMSVLPCSYKAHLITPQFVIDGEVFTEWNPINAVVDRTVHVRLVFLKHNSYF